MAVNELVNKIRSYRGWHCYHPFKSTISVVQRPDDFFLVLSNLNTTRKAEM